MNDDTTPRWTDGEPANLAAAALDAKEWLKWLRLFRAELRRGLESTRDMREWLQRQEILQQGSVERLARCITAIDRFAPTEEEEPTL